MKTLFVMTAGLMVIGHSLALAQESQRNLPPKALRAQPTTQSSSGNVPDAPIGHRQPRPADLPPETGKNNPDRIDAQDRELDRMIKNICKGC
ncbi:hypothetical protein RPMA_14370 [Tardiphaga alba]|uniref:Uncharacterized protein n=1 Tax=Tardiphaga alba TaxID=340268 RepID=A0ABX8ADJ9_9BRAD|nr:hypothetical protein [Tardiphaga alba]QUS39890.1 hypothetical protein RPMA_14370 [Tardiphaga alba]